MLRRRCQRSVVSAAVICDGPRPQLSRFGPREGRASKRIRRWAEVGFSAELDGTAASDIVVSSLSVKRFELTKHFSAVGSETF